MIVGARRTAEELGKAIPGISVITSGGDAMVSAVPGEPAVVVATPGAEPVAAGGYGAALLLDGWALLGRQDLRAAEDTLRRWMAAAALVRPRADGGTVTVVAESAIPTVQSLIRWDPVGHADTSSMPAPRSACRPRCTSPRSTARLRPSTPCSTSPNCRNGGFSGPSTCRRCPPPTGVAADSPVSRMLVRVPATRVGARGGAATGHRRVQCAARSTANPCAIDPLPSGRSTLRKLTLCT
jgi:primosomal protein N' (replication factor Y)